jgi:predicted RecA/RadA family phage recombinase
MQRIKPLHDNDPHDEINLYALDYSDLGANPEMNVEDSGIFDSGVFVYVSEADLDKEPLEFGNNAYLGKNYASKGIHVQYPSVPLKIKAVTDDTSVEILGIALRQTLTHDENGEKLLYYREKLDELQAMLPGQAVPVATNGWFTFVAAAVETGEEPVAGGKVYLKAGANATTPATLSNTDNTGANPLVGTCLAVGAGAKTGKEEVYVVKLKL